MEKQMQKNFLWLDRVIASVDDYSQVQSCIALVEIFANNYQSVKGVNGCVEVLYEMIAQKGSILQQTTLSSIN